MMRVYNGCIFYVLHKESHHEGSKMSSGASSPHQEESELVLSKFAIIIMDIHGGSQDLGPLDMEKSEFIFSHYVGDASNGYTFQESHHEGSRVSSRTPSSHQEESELVCC